MNSSSKQGGFAVLVIGLMVFAATALVVFGAGKTEKAEQTEQDDPQDHHANAAQEIDTKDFSAMVGKPSPYFELKNRDGGVYSPKTLLGKNIVLFFNEGLMCYPACWNQITSLAGDGRFAESDTVVLSVVVDSPNEWQKAVEKMPELGKAVVVFDETKAASRDFAVLNLESSMHRGNLPGHTYVIIDSQGIVRYVLDDPNMANNNSVLMEQINKFSNS